MSIPENLVKEFQMMKEWGINPESMKLQEGQDEKNKIALHNLKEYMRKWMEEIEKHPTYVDKLERCSISTFLVKFSNVRPLHPDCIYHSIVKVYVHVPEVLTKSPEKRTAIVYAHGGGVVAGRAEEYKPFTAALAVESGEL